MMRLIWETTLDIQPTCLAWSVDHTIAIGSENGTFFIARLRLGNVFIYSIDSQHPLKIFPISNTIQPITHILFNPSNNNKDVIGFSIYILYKGA